MAPSILDVQSSENYLRGHPPESVNIPLEALPQRIHELPPRSVGVQVFDPDPRRRKQARAWLRARGYPAQMVAEDQPLVRGPADPALHLWQPSAFLARMIRLLESRQKPPLSGKGRVLDIGCGSGRDAVWLAMRGYEVQGLDILPDALDKAQSLAARHGVTITTRLQDVRRNPALPPGPYQYLLMLRFLHRPLAMPITQALQSGGCFLGEAFAPAPGTSGGVPTPSRFGGPVMAPCDWPGLFPGLHELASQIYETQDGRSLSGWVGRKP